MYKMDMVLYDFLFDESNVAVSHIRNSTTLIYPILISLERNDRRKIQGYIENIIPMYTMDDFRSIFRISRNGMETLLGLIAPQLTYDEGSGGRPSTTPDKCTLVGIYYLSCGETVRKIGEKFGISDDNVLRIRKSFLRAIKTLMADFIKWPRGQRAQTVVDGFKVKHGIVAIGAIDGTHITIRPPSDFPENYINRKGHCSMILQGVCDSESLFTDVYTGWPGSVHDARVFRRSPLFETLENDTANMCPGGSFLLGDAAYPLSQYLMVPFKDNGHLSDVQKTFNFKLSSSRMKIEHTFGLLKGVWRRLKMIDVKNVQTVVDVILSTCVLHNFALLKGEDLEEFMTEEENPTNFLNVALYHDAVTGVEKRQQLLNEICSV